jgi:hypothetical protein
MKELDIDFVKKKIGEVLKNAHSDPRRQNIKDFPDRLNFCCPCCGDSFSDPNKKRANIYKDNPTYLVCFNNGCRSSITKLFKDFNVQVSIEEKQAIYDFADSHMKFDKKKDVYIPEQLTKLLNLDDFTEYLNTHPEYQISNFKPIKTNSAQYQYLKYERLIDNFENIYECDYHITPRWKEKCIVMLNKSGKKLLSMQIRNLKPGDKRLFKIFNFEKIYTMRYPDEDVDELEMMSYNKISNLYNILNVDWDEPVTITEGFLDSTFVPNSLSGIGLNSLDDISFLMSEDLNIRFLLDQDNAGVKKSLEMLDKGYKVFLWQLFVEKLIKNKTDKYEAKKYALKIKDLNKLVQEMKNPDAFNKLKLENYFSNDMLDKMYLNPDLYPKNQNFKNSKYDKNKKV